MIDRFNFYDLYGYVLPGLTLLLLIWVPQHIVAGATAGWTEAITAALVGYVAGHLLQILAQKALPSTVGRRVPSDMLWDDNDTTLTKELKALIKARIHTCFGINIDDSGNRAHAFFLCRTRLLTARAASYAEQFQGMYVMMRGITAAAILGGLHNIGWAANAVYDPPLSGWWNVSIVIAGSIAIIVSFIPRLKQHFGAWPARPPSTKRKLQREQAITAVFWILGVISFLSGVVMGEATSSDQAALLAGVAATALFVSIHTYRCYCYFAKGFATTVYRDFYTLDNHSPARPD